MTELLPFAVPLALLLLSAWFSSAETALFSLDDPQAGGARAARLLEQPRDLLVTILLGNLVVNLLFFALVPRLLAGRMSEWATGAGALLAILVFGEILPKSLAMRAGPAGARLAAPPLQALSTVLAPAGRVVGSVLDVVLRAIGEEGRAEPRIDVRHLDEALQRSAQKGHIAPGEADLLAEIVELSHLRVREIMTPRVDALMLDLEDEPEERAAVVREAARRRQSWLPVVRGDADRVEGGVRVREVLLDPDRPLESRIMPVCFVPEVGGVLQMLTTLREGRAAQAIVVDEWGGTAGVVTLEQLFEELFGELRVEGEEVERPVIPIGEGRFRVSGDLSIRDWNDLLKVEVVPTAFETVGGLVLAALDRLPRVGDRVELGGGLVGEVSEVRGRRVRTVDLFLAEGPRP
jgi:putative hemolysin